MNERLQSTLHQLRLSGLAQSLDVRLQEAAGHQLSHLEFLGKEKGSRVAHEKVRWERFAIEPPLARKRGGLQWNWAGAYSAANGRPRPAPSPPTAHHWPSRALT
jgi:hypothetical protein